MNDGADQPVGVTWTPDNLLMAKMQAGSRIALGELYDRYRDRAYRVARAVSVDDAHAEEAVQEGFVSVWNSRSSYRPERATAAPWLLTVIRHRAIDISRRENTDEVRKHGVVALEGRPAREDVAREVVDRVEAGELRLVLARLPDPQREAIFLAFYGQLTHLEIADRLGLPVGTVKGRIRLGLDKLRGELAVA